MVSNQAMYAAIEDYVSVERRRRGIVELGDHPRPEPSGEAFGEFRLLLEVQLLTTQNGLGGWTQLRDPAVLEGVYDEVQRLVARGSGSGLRRGD